jgi:hypothetical protein
MTNLLDVKHVRRSFPRGGGEELLVLDDVNLSLREGEIVGLLGRSGSGKSTLLRLIAGLTRPQGGSLSYMGTPIEGPAQGVAMVFQGFALFPWMTVLENVQLGLEALGLPEAEVRRRALAAPPYNGKADLPDIAYEQELEVDELFPVAEAMQLLRLAEVEGGDIRLTRMGRRFADADLNERKEIFSRALMNHVPPAAHIRKVLDERASHSAPKTRFLDELEDHMAEDAAEETLKTVVSWARFGELFSYDDDTASFNLENPT